MQCLFKSGFKISPPYNNTMGKLAKSEPSNVFNLVYREFSRQRYAKYKHQYPKLRESEIVSKIIKEWDSLDKSDKERLLQSYESDKFINKKEASEPDSPRGSVEKVKIERSNLDKTAERSVIVKAECKEQAINANDSDREGLSEHGSSKRSVESRSVAPSVPARKTIVGRNDYLTFYKFYYDKYHKEHKGWTSSQLTKVISMLWHKRKMQFKKASIAKKSCTQPLRSRNIDGKRLFKKQNHLNETQAKIKWTHLPKESKILWKNPSLQEQSASAKSSSMKFGGDRDMSLQDVPIASGKFSFLNNLIG